MKRGQKGVKPDGSMITCKGGQRYIKENGKWIYIPSPKKPYYVDDPKRIQRDIKLINSMYEDEFKPLVKKNKVIPGYFVSKYGKIISTRRKKPSEIKIIISKPEGTSNSKRRVLSTSFKVGIPPDFFEDYYYLPANQGSKMSSVRISTHSAVMDTWKPIDEYPPDQLKDDWDKAPESFKQWVRDTVFIDHIDDDPTNNCLDNLRRVTPLQNHFRRKKYLNETNN